jgi:Na+-transporting NADH:ubiquinone oxidoreductase subunit A
MSTAAQSSDNHGTVRITRGLDLPLQGRPAQRVEEGRNVGRVALLGRDYVGLKPRLLVQEGDEVRLGQPLFADKGEPRVVFTSPGCGRVRTVNRGERRAFVSLVVELAGEEEVRFPAWDAGAIASLAGGEIEARLLESGLWTAFRSRPFERVPLPGSRPAAIFVTAMDTNPLAADPAVVIGHGAEFFRAGLQLLLPLTAGPVYLCQAEGTDIPAVEGVTRATFAGCHPAGLAGTHIHFLEPVSLQRQVWHLGYQDVIAMGALFLTGRILTERVVALGGARVKRPRLLRTRLGADLS